ncbi:tight adherence protein B [Agromyces sp. CF514]|uniref:type II secretion system F family protein n=1 Tax=Agromyces sp. CF514 TaxID=1881031 RepID=UPI0008F1F625|nr:type II secretion system F family protein [Agromyces sp. CF514]SFR85487.1 tight adherence protein B [Agromyces sp. CF514]
MSARPDGPSGALPVAVASAVEAVRARAPMLRRSPDAAAGIDHVAGVVERLAVLLSAGVAASAAWRHLAESGERDPVLVAAAEAGEQGAPIAEAIAKARAGLPAEGGWAVLAAAWQVASTAGAPLTVSLRDLAAAMRDEAQVRREVRTSLAGPAASARMVLALPLVALVFGSVLGFDTATVLLGNPIGLACLVLGLAFLWIALRWSRALAARAAAFDEGAGLELELLSIGMAGGASVERARELVDAALRMHGLGSDAAPPSAARAATRARVGPGAAGAGATGVGRAAASARLDETVRLAERAGAPLVELLRAEAQRGRRIARTDAATRGAALGVRLMLPLGLCVLPAFVLLGVAPLLISVVTGTLGGAA